jgi:hypothetical protein
MRIDSLLLHVTPLRSNRFGLLQYWLESGASLRWAAPAWQIYDFGYRPRALHDMYASTHGDHHCLD